MEIGIARMREGVIAFDPVLTRKDKKKERKKERKIRRKKRLYEYDPFFIITESGIFRRATRTNNTATVHKQGKRSEIEF